MRVALAVLILAGILFLIFVYGEKERTRDRSSAMVQADLKGISNALKFYKLDCGSYPTNDVGLEVLLEFSNDSCDQGLDGYLSILPSDPWGNPYRYRKIDEDTFEIASLGKDGKEGGSGSSKDTRLQEPWPSACGRSRPAPGSLTNDC